MNLDISTIKRMNALDSVPERYQSAVELKV